MNIFSPTPTGGRLNSIDLDTLARARDYLRTSNRLDRLARRYLERAVHLARLADRKAVA